jgi:hypothetical protein
VTMGLMDQMNPWSSREVVPTEMPTEETPFQHTAQENMKAAPEYLKQQALKLNKLSKEGPLSFRVMAFLGGLGMIVAALYDFISNIVFFSRAVIMISVYTLVFGAGICTLEGKIFSFPDSWQRGLKFYFRILDYTWGRGLLYAFAGSLQMTQPNKINLIVGTYMIMVGVVALVSSIGAGQRLADLRVDIDSQRDLKTCFQKYDTNRDGALTEKEFAILLGSLGVDVTYQELVACFIAIDKNDDDRISYEEFNSWWTEWGTKHLHRCISDDLV